MGAKRHAARAMNSAYNLANRRELGKAQIMLRRKNALEKVVHARAQAFINQVGQGAPAAAPPVIIIACELSTGYSPAIALQKANAIHILLR